MTITAFDVVVDGAPTTHEVSEEIIAFFRAHPNPAREAGWLGVGQVPQHVAFAESKGFHFTPEELWDFITVDDLLRRQTGMSIMAANVLEAGSDELTDAELDMLAGGGPPPLPCIAYHPCCQFGSNCVVCACPPGPGG